MKELSIEEKAKRYDEALEKARQIHNANRVSGIELTTCEEIFPELKESEDERTWIINYLNNRKLNSSIIEEKENIKRALDWLEKQGKEQKIPNYGRPK